MGKVPLPTKWGGGQGAGNNGRTARLPVAELVAGREESPRCSRDDNEEERDALSRRCGRLAACPRSPGSSGSWSRCTPTTMIHRISMHDTARRPLGSGSTPCEWWTATCHSAAWGL